MSSNEHKYVQLLGKKNEDVKAWRMRVKAYMSKHCLWYVFEKGNCDDSEKYRKDSESARNELISWLGDKFVKLSQLPDITTIMDQIEEAHENMHPRLSATEIKTSLYSKKAPVAGMEKFIE